MAGGIVFTGHVAALRDQWGCLVVCSRCGGDAFDVTLRGGEADQLDCANPACGQPLDAAARAGGAEAGR